MNTALWQKLAVGVPAGTVYGGIGASNQVYKQQNLLKDTLFMRLSFDGTSFDPAIAVLCTPADGGVVLTTDADYAWSDQLKLFASARVMGGRQYSAYRQSAIRWQAWVGLVFSGSVL